MTRNLQFAIPQYRPPTEKWYQITLHDDIPVFDCEHCWLVRSAARRWCIQFSADQCVCCIYVWHGLMVTSSRLELLPYHLCSQQAAETSLHSPVRSLPATNNSGTTLHAIILVIVIADVIIYVITTNGAAVVPGTTYDSPLFPRCRYSAVICCMLIVWCRFRTSQAQNQQALNREPLHSSILIGPDKLYKKTMWPK